MARPKDKWYGKYKNRRLLLCKHTKRVFEITGRKHKEKLLCIKTLRMFQFEAKWATVKHLKRGYTLLNNTTMQVLYGSS